MKTIIVGAGEVGFHIASRLSKDGHDVTVVERDVEKGNLLRDKLNALVVQGSGSSAEILEKAGISKTELFIAVTDIDEVNLVSCILAKAYNVPNKIARVKNDEFTNNESKINAKALGIELLINPQQVVANDICSAVFYSNATEVAEFAGGEVIFLSYPISKESPLADLTLQEIGEKRKNLQLVLTAINRDGETIIPHGSHKIKAGDSVSLVCKKKDIVSIRKFFGLKADDIDKVFILGAGRVGHKVAARLSSDKRSVKVIDRNPVHCEALEKDKTLDNVLVLCSDSTDVETLKNEGVDKADVFIAATQDDQANILGALVAKRCGVKRTIILVNNPELVQLAPSLGINLCISPRLATASAILKFIKGDNVFSIAMLEQIDAEVIEFKLTEDSKILDKPIHSLQIPEGMIIGAIVRDTEIIIPHGGDQLLTGDHVVVFALESFITKVEKFFS